MRLPGFLIAAAIASAAATLGCNDTTSSGPVGTISVQVVDANNVGVPLVNVDLFKLVDGGAVPWRARRTSSDGTTVFGETDGGIEAGSYYVHVSFITNYALAANETNDKAVTVQGGDNPIVTFHTVANTPGR